MCYLLRLKRGIGYETNKHTTGAKSWMSQIAENVENIKSNGTFLNVSDLTNHCLSFCLFNLIEPFFL